MAARKDRQITSIADEISVKDGLIDLDAVTTEIAAIVKDGSPDGPKARAKLLALFKSVIDEGRNRAEALLLKDGGGLKCAARLSSLQDVVIGLLHDFATRHVIGETNRSSAEKMTIVAVGGYGRGTLAPESDIDLLFLLPYKQTPWGESVVEFILYMLWDLRFKVGHATRDVNECVRLSKQDMTIRTALLEARYLWGDRALFDEMEARFDKEVVRGTSAQFIEAKMAERDTRHRKAGDTRYLVEPNLKEGKGGLRDLHTLFWISKYFYRVKRTRDLVKMGVLSDKEAKLFKKSEDFLWAVRCHMHFLTKRADERLTFDLQRDMAHRLNYRTAAGLSDVERFMKHYFLTAKSVGHLTNILSSRLEAEQVKATPGISRFVSAAFTGRRTTVKGAEGFLIEKKRIIAARDDVFEKDPVNLLRAFKAADETGYNFHPDLFYLMSKSLKLIDSKLRSNDEANRIFLEILTSKRDPEAILRKMNEAGVLGRFIPAFGKVVAMMQFNMYHHYTVDEHTIRTIGVLSALERGTLKDETPLSNRLIEEVDDRTILYITLFLHDIAKGRAEDHSIAGERVAKRFGKRLKLTDAQTETIAWLVREHLTMSMVAQSRDLSDPKTIRDFANIVQTPERLKLLLLLTVCDIRGVGPGVWNGWKGQLLRTLYYETLPVLTGGYNAIAVTDRVERAKTELAETLSDWPKKAAEVYVERHYPAYLLRTAPEEQTRHAHLVRAADEEGDGFATSVRTSGFEDVTEITVYARDHPSMLNVLAGACKRTGANIVGAQIYTTRDGFALDIINLSREFQSDEDELRRARRIETEIRSALSGKPSPETGQPLQIGGVKRSSKAFTVATEILINNTLSNKFTVIEASGKDRNGLLHDLARAIFELNLNISSAHIATFGERAVDVFYVTDMMGEKITDKMKQDAIKRHLAKAFASPEPKPAKRAA
ncbi:MAG: [protein-PII] uridylyltransferase [Pseudomonadota bacterium]